MAFNYSAAPERFRVVAETLGIDGRGLNHNQIRQRLVEHLIAFKQSVGFHETLKLHGVSTSDIPFLSRHAMEDPASSPTRASPASGMSRWCMPRPSEEQRQALLGLGSHSARKSHYPELLSRLEELETERNRYKWLFEHAVHGIFQASLQEGLRAANPALARMLGYDSPEQLLWALTDLASHLFVGGEVELAHIRAELQRQQAVRLRRACVARTAAMSTC